MRYLLTLSLAFLSACASGPEVRPDESHFFPTPHLWSGHKVIDLSPEACAEKGVEILKALSFISVVRNGSYAYGNLMANRAAIKCVQNGDHTFVYVAVAGPRVQQVEKLRNEIVWRL